MIVDVTMSANLRQAVELSSVSLQNEFEMPLPNDCHRQCTSSHSQSVDLTGARLADIQKKVQGNSFSKKTSLVLPLKSDCLAVNVVSSNQVSSVGAVEGQQQVSLTRPTSLPGMLQPSQCHCSACCSCSPHQQNCFIPSLSLSRTSQSLSASLDAGICNDNSNGIVILSPVTPEFCSKTVANGITDYGIQNETLETPGKKISHAANERASELDQELGRCTSSVSSSHCTVVGKLPVASPTPPAMAETAVSNGDSVFSELHSLSPQCQLVLTANLQPAHSCRKPEWFQRKATESFSTSIVPAEFKEKLQVNQWLFVKILYLLF